jgi:[phosphatase 2A protein]-leucine-carboxy methyltransferase
MLPPSTSRNRPQFDPDEAIRLTDDDAAASRLSAVNLGYLDDPFVSYLYRPKYGESSTSGSRKPPLINVGTHHRTYAIDVLVDQFLEKGGKQIVSLGAGSDTRFWRLMVSTKYGISMAKFKADFQSRKDRPDITTYIEIDFPHLTSLKAQRISRSPKLSTLLGPNTSDATRPYTISKGGTQLSSSIYTLLPLDLKESPSTTLTSEVLPLLDTSLPTLFLAECVLCYLHPDVGERIITWFGETFEDCAGVIYEMCGLE